MIFLKIVVSPKIFDFIFFFENFFYSIHSVVINDIREEKNKTS